MKIWVTTYVFFIIPMYYQKFIKNSIKGFRMFRNILDFFMKVYSIFIKFPQSTK